MATVLHNSIFPSSHQSFLPGFPLFSIRKQQAGILSYGRKDDKIMGCSVVSPKPTLKNGTFFRRDLFLIGISTSISLTLPSSECFAAGEVKMAPVVDEINAYSYLYPVELTDKKFLFKWVESRKPERYSSAAPLSPDARLRIVSERVDIIDNLIISVSVGPPNVEILKSKDKSTWTAKDVADAVLSDKSTLRVTSTQRLAESTVLDAHTSDVDGEPYWYYDYLVRKSPTKNVQAPNLYRHYVATTAERDGYLYSLSASTLSKQWDTDLLNQEKHENRRDSFKSNKGLLHVSDKLLVTNSPSISPEVSTLPLLMFSYIDQGSLSQAQSIWDEIMNSSLVPSSPFVFQLINAYVSGGHFDTLVQTLNQLHLKKCSSFLPDAYKHAILSAGRKGNLEQMEILLKEMTKTGLPVDSLTGNAFLVYYCKFGTLPEMEFAYDRLKRSQILIEEQAIRAVSSCYIKEGRFYSLGKFIEDVGVGRRNVGNLLWNLLLLSYAANFKMKSLQRAFVRMVESGFHPDLTTFNIRALAFSRMALFWDLHLSLEHMKHESVIPDLVTYGCVVDSYFEKGLGRNMDFALRKMNVRDSVKICTDEVVFQVMGKGDFHLSSEAFMEFNSGKDWRYKHLIHIYQKKLLRSN